MSIAGGLPPDSRDPRYLSRDTRDIPLLMGVYEDFDPRQTDLMSRVKRLVSPMKSTMSRLSRLSQGGLLGCGLISGAIRDLDRGGSRCDGPVLVLASCLDPLGIDCGPFAARFLGGPRYLSRDIRDIPLLMGVYEDFDPRQTDLLSRVESLVSSMKSTMSRLSRVNQGGLPGCG